MRKDFVAMSKGERSDYVRVSVDIDMDIDTRYRYGYRCGLMDIDIDIPCEQRPFIHEETRRKKNFCTLPTDRPNSPPPSRNQD